MMHQEVVPILFNNFNCKPQIESKVIIMKSDENVGTVKGYDTNPLIIYETYMKCKTIKENGETCTFPESSLIYNSIHEDGSIIVERNTKFQK
tara:strand:+ start:962 stop:1237 length:276 start_codon:yes stop_codon:yes gene_type:complete